MNSNRLLDLFCELVRIESPSRREAAMAGRCADELRSLGFEVRFDGSASQTGSDTGNLIAHLPGTAGGAIVLSAHMDTVQPCAARYSAAAAPMPELPPVTMATCPMAGPSFYANC